MPIWFSTRRAREVSVTVVSVTVVAVAAANSATSVAAPTRRLAGSGLHDHPVAALKFSGELLV